MPGPARVGLKGTPLQWRGLPGHLLVMRVSLPAQLRRRLQTTAGRVARTADPHGAMAAVWLVRGLLRTHTLLIHRTFIALGVAQ